MSMSNRRVIARVRTATAAVGVAALVTLGTLVAAGTPASAQAATAPVPVTTTTAGASPATRNIQEVPEVGVCATCAPPLLYRGGPGMGSSLATGTITVTPIYWSPTGLSAFTSFDPTYVALNNRYLTDIAAASNTTGNVYSVLPEYPTNLNGAGVSMKYSIAAGTPRTDTTAYPTTGQCTPTAGAGYTACITDAQLKTELTAYLSANALTANLNNFYPVFFPPNVQTQLNATNLSNVQYCGYHSNVASGTSTIVYGNEPFPVYPACWPAGAPNNDAYAEESLTTLSHELLEAFTDPLANNPTYYDAAGNEIGDECNLNYGPPLGTVTTATYGPQYYNQVINGNKYYTQTEFSNAAYKATGVGTGCRGSAYIPPAPAARRTADSTGIPAMVTVDASPESLPADGTSTSTVTVTAYDAAGEPIVGDPIHVSVRDDNATPGTCGTLNIPGGPVPTGLTNANGQVTVTYTASTANIDCYVLATESQGGETNQTLIYQGTARTTAPAVTQTTPGSLIAGGPLSTFTVTATNPSARPIDDARFTVHLTGDANTTTALNAGQVTLSYKDEATNGAFVAVPLTGTTAGHGQIDGFVIPDTATRIPAGTQRTATFQLSLTGGAPTSATTGAPLRIQTDLDQFNPADASETNLDYAGPTTVPVLANPGDSVTYTGKVSVTSAPTPNTNGSATLVANKCTFASDATKCTLTGTETLTPTGGTLHGFISTNNTNGTGDRTFSFTETFTTSTTATTTHGTGTGTGQMVYFDDGSTTTHTLTSTFTDTPTQAIKVDTEQGTITIAPAN